MSKVLKFGGTSMANAESISKVADIVKADGEAKYVVVSAPGKREKTDVKVTDLLINFYGALGHDKKNVFESIKNRFEDIISGLGIALDLSSDYAEIFNNAVNGAGYDYIVSRGEYLSAKVLAAYLSRDFVDAASFVVFSRKGAFDADETQKKASGLFSKVENVIIPGFYGADDRNDVHTFSRGGSDVTGAIVARAVNASVYENWTDVSGFMVCDPRIVKNPKIIDMLTFRELRELSYMGAGVLHPESVFPVREAGIPINIRNTFAPSDPGTLIVPVEGFTSGKYRRARRVITGIAGKKDFVGIFVEHQMMNGEVGFCKKLLDILYRYNISLEHMPTGIDTVTLIIDTVGTNEETIQNAVNDIIAECEPNHVEITRNLALLAVVGHGMSRNMGTASRVFKCLSDANVNIRMIDQGSSEMNIIIAVENNDYEKATKAIYEEFEE